MMVYADNAATTCVSKTALDAMLPYLTTNYGNPSSLYAFAQTAKEGLENARATIARLLGAAERSVLAHLYDLRDRALVEEEGDTWRIRA